MDNSGGTPIHAVVTTQATTNGNGAQFVNGRRRSRFIENFDEIDPPSPQQGNHGIAVSSVELFDHLDAKDHIKARLKSHWEEYDKSFIMKYLEMRNKYWNRWFISLLKENDERVIGLINCLPGKELMEAAGGAVFDRQMKDIQKCFQVEWNSFCQWVQANVDKQSEEKKEETKLEEAVKEDKSDGNQIERKQRSRSSDMENGSSENITDHYGRSSSPSKRRRSQ
jgi:hypothetical protein